MYVKLFLMPCLLAFGCFFATSESAAQLIITGVFDGPLPGGRPKGIELYATESIADLSVFAVGSANNGGGTDGEEFFFPADSINAGEFIYVASEDVDFQNFFGFTPNYTTGAMSVNGDDAVELFGFSQVIDVFGEIDADGTGSGWEYTDGWAYRSDGTGPDSNVFSSSRWNFSGIDALDGAPSNDTATVAVPIGTFVPENPAKSVALQAGDADQNLTFDQLDLVRVQVASKYRTGSPATWGEGDWNGAPGGRQGSPPTGNGVFDQFDVIAALAASVYLTGPYAAQTPPRSETNGAVASLGYDDSTGEMWISPASTGPFTSINLISTEPIFRGAKPGQLAGSFDVFTEDNLFKATFGGSFVSIQFGPQPGLSQEFLESNISVIGTDVGGNSVDIVDTTYVPVPEPSPLAMVCLALGLLVLKRCVPNR